MYIQEWQRTVLLFILLGVAIGFLFWTQGQYSNNFVDTFQDPASSQEDLMNEE